jgi:hypothetical protein
MSVSQEQKIQFKNLAFTAIKNFEKRHLHAQYVATSAEAVSEILELIPEGSAVGAADSETLEQIGIFPALRKRGKNRLILPLLRKADGHLVKGHESVDRMMRKVLLSDIFVCGSNAITLDGKVVNIDGGGNRVAPMIFGPGKVIVVVGVNKIVKDVDSALNRIKQICAPVNAMRHGLQHHDAEFLDLPCSRTGICADCRQPQRICNFTSIIEGESHWSSGRMNIIIIGKSLGI